MLSDSDKSETQHIEFKSDSFSSMVSNKSRLLRVQDDNDSIEYDECITVPDELVGV